MRTRGRLLPSPTLHSCSLTARNLSHSTLLGTLRPQPLAVGPHVQTRPSRKGGANARLREVGGGSSSEEEDAGPACAEARSRGDPAGRSRPQAEDGGLRRSHPHSQPSCQLTAAGLTSVTDTGRSASAGAGRTARWALLRSSGWSAGRRGVRARTHELTAARSQWRCVTARITETALERHSNDRKIFTFLKQL